MKAEFSERLSELIAFRSISTDSAHTEHCHQTADYLQRLMLEWGFSVQRFELPKSNPVLLGELMVDANRPTTLIYGHYDVQPAEPGGWKSDPFALVEREGYWYGRGVADNKGQLLIHLFSIRDLHQSGQLKRNVKFLIEGNEETGSPELEAWLKKEHNQLDCDEIIISDGALLTDRPTIDASLRGTLSATLSFRSAKMALHSGIFGGAVPNAAQLLATALSDCFDGDGDVIIPGFDAGVMNIPKQTSTRHSKIFDPERLKSETGIRALPKRKLDYYSQVGLRPALEITSLRSGYQGEGYANLIPDVATAKLNIRLAPGQEPARVWKAVEKFITDRVPRSIAYELTHTAMEPAVSVDLKKPVFKRATALAREVYRKPVDIRHGGGSIPVVGWFATLLGHDPLLFGFANADCGMHGANENFEIALAEKGIAFSHRYFGERGKLTFR